MALRMMFLLLSLAVLIQAQSALITLPSSYNVVVSRNVPNLGVTWAYREYYNAGQQMWRTDFNGTINIFNLTSNTHAAISTTCTSYNYDANSTRNGIYRPSVLGIPSSFDTVPVLRNDARGINASYYFSSSNQTLNWGNETTPVNITMEYYFNEETGLPVRIVESFYNKTEEPQVFIFSVYTDWVNWEVIDLTDSTFSVPADCPLSTDVPSFFRNITSTVDPNPLPVGSPFPTLAANFYAVVEGKLASDVSGNEVVGADWYYDSKIKRERVDLSIFTWSDNQHTEFYDYTANLTWVYNYFGICDEPVPLTSSILTNKGVGTVHQLLVPSSDSPLKGFNITAAEYVGREFVRGVSADTWVIRGVEVTDTANVTYKFDTSVYFFPQGWQFFGRQMDGSAVPMRVKNSGTKGENEHYEGIWDLFLYTNNEQNASVFDVTALGCSPVPSTYMNVSIPTAYSVFVSFNDITNGMTFAYEEFADSTKNISRVFMYGGDSLIIDINENTVYAFYPYNLTKQCQTFAYDDDEVGAAGAVFQPWFLSIAFLQQQKLPLQSMGSVSVRGILAYHYALSTAGFNIDMYIDSYTGYLVREVIHYVPQNVSNPEDKPLYFVVDWVDWTPSPNETVFTKPTQCEASPLIFDAPMYNSTLTENTTFPAVPSKFFMIMEGKSDAFGRQGVEWYFDSEANMERIETLDVDTGASFLTIDRSNSTTYTSINGTCVQSNDTYSSILTSGTGFIHAFFDPSSHNITGFGPSSAKFGAFELLRDGVNATRFDYTNLSLITAAGNYTFDAYVYYYPQGWSFPLRNITTQRVPLRVTVNGEFTVNDNGTDSVSVPYKEQWDLYVYYPSAPDASAFAPCAASVIPLPPPPLPTPAPTSPPPTKAPTTGTTTSITSAAGKGGRSLGSGAKAGIAVVIIVAVLSLLVGVWLTVRKRRGAAAPSGAPRENRTFEQMHEEEF